MKGAVLLVGLLWLLFGCSQQEKDEGIKEMIATAAKKEVGFAGVNYVVSNGMVTLTGKCPSEKDKQKVEKSVREISGVRHVLDQIVVAPVLLTTDFPLKQSVDSVLMKYPTVEASVKDSVITVQGNVDSKTAQKILQGLQSLNARRLNNELTTDKETP